jgi:hypothetical protein
MPSIHDVLLGRGRPYQDHPGNIRMASRIDGLRGEYHFAPRMKKKEMSELVVKRIKESSGRFLKRSPSLNAWEEVNDSVARGKASQGFRTQIRINNPAPASARSTTEATGCSKSVAILPRPVLQGSLAQPDRDAPK